MMWHDDVAKWVSIDDMAYEVANDVACKVAGDMAI